MNMISSDQVTFRLARPGNGADISNLRHAVWASTYRGIYPDELIEHFDHTWHTARNEMTLGNPAYTTYLICMNEQPMGYLIWHIEQPPRYKNFSFCLQSLYLLPCLQGHGVGRRAMDMVRQACIKAGFDRLYWQCHPENEKALAFYQRMGAVIAQRDEGHAEKHMNTVYFEWIV